MHPEPEELPAPESALSGYRTPEVLGLAGVVVAVAALLGFGLLSGQFVLALGEQAGPPSQALQLLASLVGATLGAIPLLLGLEATRLLLEDDPLWVSAVARAAVVLGALVVLLRLVHLLVQSLADNPAYVGV